MDEDKNGVITYNEFKYMMHKLVEDEITNKWFLCIFKFQILNMYTNPFSIKLPLLRVANNLDSDE